MMMNKWRSLFGTGCLVAVLALFGATTAFAVDPPDDPASVMVSVPTDSGFNTLSVAWMHTPAAAGTDGKAVTFEIAYKQQTGRTFDAGEAPDGTMTVDVTGASSYRVDVTGLKSGKLYLVAVRAKNNDATANVGDWEYATANVSTSRAPQPANVDHRAIEITEYNEALGVEWREPLAGHEDLMIEKYQVAFSTKKTSGWKRWHTDPEEPMVMITGLTTGTMYYVRIKAVNDAEGVSAEWSTLVMGTPGGEDAEDAEDAEDEDDAEDDMVPDQLNKPDVYAGDSHLYVYWDAPTGTPSDAPVTDYSVRYMQKGGSWTDHKHDGVEEYTTIDDLNNGVAYYVQVAAINKHGMGEYSESVMGTPRMETPALPFFGAFALGAGLLAAGRARLRRRRELRAGRTRGRLTR